MLLSWNQELSAAGKAPADLQYYDDNAAATLALLSGRVDATFGPNATAAWAARDTGETKVVGVVPGRVPAAGRHRRGHQEGQRPRRAGADRAERPHRDGKYAEVLKAWNLDSEGISTSQINPPGLPKS